MRHTPQNLTSQAPAYVLITVVIVVSVGAILSYAFLAVHINEPMESEYIDAHRRAIVAAETALTIAIEDVRHFEDPVVVGWDDHAGIDGAIVEMKDYDQSSSSAQNLDVAGYQVSRYDDNDWFNYNPEFFRIVAIGLAKNKLGKNMAYYGIEAIVRIPRKDWRFSNVNETLDHTYALITADDPVESPAYIANRTVIIGDVLSTDVPSKIFGLVNGTYVFESMLSAVPADPVGPTFCNDVEVACPGMLTGGWQRLLPGVAPSTRRPQLTLEDYGFDDQTGIFQYKIDGVTFTATELTQNMYQANSDPFSWPGVDDSTKTNPANVIVYNGADTLVLDSHDYRLSVYGTIVAKSIELRDSTPGVFSNNSMDFYFTPAIQGFPAIVCDTLRLGDGTGNANTNYQRTLVDGPVIVRKYFYGEGDTTQCTAHCGGITIWGFVATDDAGNGEDSGQGFYHGPAPADWSDPWTGWTGADGVTVMIVAEENGEPSPYTELRMINGVQKGLAPADVETVYRLNGESGIEFSGTFLTTWNNYVSGS